MDGLSTLARQWHGSCRRRTGAQLAYVVGDQASYLRVMIRTGRLIGQIAESLGYELTGIDLFRTRVATATGAKLREEVVLLRWPGPNPRPRRRGARSDRSRRRDRRVTAKADKLDATP